MALDDLLELVHLVAVKFVINAELVNLVPHILGFINFENTLFVMRDSYFKLNTVSTAALLDCFLVRSDNMF